MKYENPVFFIIQKIVLICVFTCSQHTFCHECNQLNQSKQFFF